MIQIQTIQKDSVDGGTPPIQRRVVLRSSPVLELLASTYQ
jgi:hypothetical protein